MLITAAAVELDRTAYAYREAARVLRSVTDHVPGYFAQLQNAQQVHWHSQAGEAFVNLVEELRLPGSMIEVQAPLLAVQAEGIATDLASYAETARQLRTILTVLSSVDFADVAQDLGAARLETLRSTAAEATVSTGRFIQYIQENGGIPDLLRRAADRVW